MLSIIRRAIARFMGSTPVEPAPPIHRDARNRAASRMMLMDVEPMADYLVSEAKAAFRAALKDANGAWLPGVDMDALLMAWHDAARYTVAHGYVKYAKDIEKCPEFWTMYLAMAS